MLRAHAISSIMLVTIVIKVSGALHADDQTIARWRLTSSIREDHDRYGDSATSNLSFDPKVGASFWDGSKSEMTIPSFPVLSSPHTICMWVKVDPDADTPGDLISAYDPKRHRGFTLSIVTRGGVTHSQANHRQLQWGSVERDVEPSWRDHGQIGKAVYVHSLAVCHGKLYAGTCEPGEGQAGHVYQFVQDQTWRDLGSPDKANAVISMAEYESKLHVATGCYRLAGSALPESLNQTNGGNIFRWDEDKWTPVGSLPGTTTAGGLVVFRGKLYASALYRPAGFFRYEPPDQWIAEPLPDGDKRVESMAVFGERLFATSYDNAHVYSFDGKGWVDAGAVGDNTQCYGFAIHHGRLCVSTWPSGKVYRYNANNDWEDLGRLGQETEVMGMAVHNGALFGGTLPLASVYRFDAPGQWRHWGDIDPTPNVKYRRAWSMAVYQGRLFVGTLPSGRVYSTTHGESVTWDRAFPLGWHHVAAVRGEDKLALYVDGELVADAPASPPSATDAKSPLAIGSGPNDHFRGWIKDVRIEAGVVDSNKIKEMMREVPPPKR